MGSLCLPQLTLTEVPCGKQLWKLLMSISRSTGNSSSKIAKKPLGPLAQTACDEQVLASFLGNPRLVVFL